MGAPRSLVGIRFDRLLVVGPAASINGRVAWKCLCDCGNTINTMGQSLKSGATGSCGCRRLARLRAKTFTHRLSKTPEYKVWCCIKRRCQSPDDHKYYDYGARGIALCDRWQSFSNFIADMGRRPAPNLTVERRDNNRGYEPSNCCWATPQQQMRNTRIRRDNTSGYTGVQPCKKKWRAMIGVNHGCIHLGVFHTFDEALAARLIAEEKYGFTPKARRRVP